MRKKLRSRKGITLVEMLAVTVVLILLGLMLQTGLNMASGSYQNMQGESETQLLLSTVSDVLSDELRYARDVRVENDEAHSLRDFTSVSYGRYTVLSVSKDGQLYANEDSSNSKRMLAAGAYGNGAYTISNLDISYEDGIFTVYIKVEGAGAAAAEANLTIRCLNAD